MNTVKIIIAGGGTGGHLYPAIAIADKIKELLKNKVKTEILFIGTKRGLEFRIKDKLNYPLETLSIRGIARSLTLKNLLVPFAIVGSLIKMNSIMNRFKPDMVIGTGGYVCWPVVSTAIRKNIPAVLQEQNSYPGLSIRKLAAKVLLRENPSYMLTVRAGSFPAAENQHYPWPEKGAPFHFHQGNNPQQLRFP